mgnify:CR=1 FL=1
MRKVLLIYFCFSFLSCGIIENLQRRRALKKVLKENNVSSDLDKKKCNIDAYSSTKKYKLNIIDYKDLYKSGDKIVLSMDSEQFSFGQATQISLFHNNIQVYSFGKWLIFNANKREVVLPRNMISENAECFDIRIFYASDEVYVSKTFLMKNK